MILQNVQWISGSGYPTIILIMLISYLITQHSLKVFEIRFFDICGDLIVSIFTIRSYIPAFSIKINK